MVRLSSMRFVPVVELTPYSYAADSRSAFGRAAADAPEEWRAYWKACLADSGVTGVEAIAPSSCLVPTTELSMAQVAAILAAELEGEGIPGFPDADGEEEPDLAERISALYGGFVLFDQGEALIVPGCCGSLSDLKEWRVLSRAASSEWTTVWNGHPVPRVRTVNGDLEIEETQEYGLPLSPKHLVVATVILDAAIADAEREQRRFCGTIRAALDTIAALGAYSNKQRDELARLLVGMPVDLAGSASAR